MVFLGVFMLALLLAPARPGAILPAQHLLHLERVLEIGPEAHDFSRMLGITPLPDGSIAVGQPQDGNMIRLSRQGVVIKRYGRSGEGPGEFVSLGDLRGIHRDSLWATDLLAQRTTLFSLNGSGSLDIRLPSIIGGAGYPLPGRVFSPRVHGMASNGDLIVQGLLRDVGRKGVWSTGMPQEGTVYMRIPRSGGIPEPIVAVAHPFDQCTTVVNGRRRPQPECPRPETTVALDGGDVATATQVADSRPDSGVILIVRVDEGGDTLFTTRLQYRRALMTSAREDSIRNDLTDRASDALRKDWHDIELPEALDELKRILISMDGDTWVELRARDGYRPWLVLDPAGHLRAWVKLALNQRLEAVKDGILYVLEQREDGSEVVVGLRITNGQ